MKKRSIKVKAMGLFASEGRLLVNPGFDSVKQEAYLRLPGGHVEFGERSERTLAREMFEELGAEVEVLALLDVVQNHFTFEGRPFHEIVFIHHARFRDPAFTQREIMPNIEAGHDENFKWLAMAEALNGPCPLFPSADYARFLDALANG
jgi:ADP-ribose pyrophosphatase YjhB (NUDIX family)